MPLFPANFVDDLKSHVDIVQIVQERVPLRKSGATWKGLCPFHGEKTPSFHVNGDKGFFHCFGCGVGGDVIKFVELHEKVSFTEAVRMLATRFGLAIPETPEDAGSGTTSAEREALLKVHEVAAEWFRTQLLTPAATRVRKQLRWRGAIVWRYPAPGSSVMTGRNLREGSRDDERCGIP
jgi:DNA primase